MKNILLLIGLTVFSLQMNAQNRSSENPKLVVGIVVDQMRYDYLTRFWNKFGEEGFKKLVSEGFEFKNNHFNYSPTSTGPGHASVWTGTSPMNHGIIGNDWYNKFEDKIVYCAGDDDVKPVGTQSDAGKMSPHRMKATTIADQNRLHTQMRGKTIGVSIKDRGAIFPAGHTANAAYWYQGGNEGKFISSSYYMDKLPEWTNKFNTSGAAQLYLKKTWNTMYDIGTYTESGDDINDFERAYNGKEIASFPYDIADLSEQNGNYDILPQTPFGNDLTLDFAIAAIEGEELGQDEDTDFLALSFSSTDKIGHQFGVNSKEVEDTYIRLDKNISELIQYLDEKVGKNNYTLFLTADHGAGNVASYLQSNKIPTGKGGGNKNFKDSLFRFVENEFGNKNLIKKITSGNLFFNYQMLLETGISAKDLEERLAHYLIQQKAIFRVFTRSQLQNGYFSKGIGNTVQNGFNHKRSGDVIFITDPGSGSLRGSGHGSVFNYDTHVPLLFYGNGVKQGSTHQPSEIVDIAPTVAALLGIEYPNATTGKPLAIMLDNFSK